MIYGDFENTLKLVTDNKSNIPITKKYQDHIACIYVLMNNLVDLKNLV